MSEGKSKRGFASMSPERRREIASMGGKKAHELGIAHQFTPEEARHAGRKGGMSVSQNREHMASIGRAGGKSRGQSQAREITSAQQTAQERKLEAEE